MNWVFSPLWRLPWPTPALATWTLSWGLFVLLRQSTPLAALTAAMGLSAGAAWLCPGTTWRRALIGAGFPLSLLASGLGQGLPPLAWALALAALALIYPLQSWRDAPMFPTPAHALDGLAEAASLSASPRVLDVGCGMGHGLQALRLALPAAQVEGIERSWPLALLTRARCRFARVQQGDMWRQHWQGFDLVYLFQRPETMARAWDKACAEMAPGRWLASLEFEVPGRAPDAVLRNVPGKPVWLYQVGGARQAPRTQPAGVRADKFTERGHLRAGAQHRG